MRYWIMDKDESPQRFPLQKLLIQAAKAAGLSIEANCSCLIIKARGYGLGINALDKRLDSDGEVEVSCQWIIGLCEGVNEWFYDLEVRFAQAEIVCGLHDSSALFIEAEPMLANEIVSKFKDYRRDVA